MTVAKVCGRCKEMKLVTAFRPQSQGRPGYSSWCKSCHNEANREWDKAHPDRARQHRLKANRKWRSSHPQESYAATNKSKSRNPEKYKAIQRKAEIAHKERFPERAAARQAVLIAVRSGRLVRQTCEVCGDPQSQGHHDDYSKPLTVRWLCRKHHVEHHRNKRG